MACIDIRLIAVLLFGKRPQSDLIETEVKCGRFEGNDPVTFLDEGTPGGQDPQSGRRVPFPLIGGSSGRHEGSID